VHIWLCNSMARTNRRIFLAESGKMLALDSPRTRRHSLYGLLVKGIRQWLGLTNLASPPMGRPDTVGICTREVRMGDRVVLLDGLSMPLIIRPFRPGSFSFRLVSPAIVEIWAAIEDLKSFSIEGDLEEFIIS
jgi:hypothetical protein